MSLENLAESLAEAARDLGSDDVERILEKAVTLAVEMIQGCDAAGVTLVRSKKKLETPVFTEEWVARGDALQYELGEGPCMDAVWQQQLVVSRDLADEKRWPTWGPRVVNELGARSMMCVQLFTSAQTVGALNMYCQHVNGFDEEKDRHEAHALAAHAAVALVAAQKIEHLSAALDTRTVIGQAEGILMERFDIEPERAFEVLKRVSSHTNEKLHRVASELVRTRRLPDTDSASTG
jgi:transcriptional regulator with GAF, ATPase, and Fis domain